MKHPTITEMSHLIMRQCISKEMITADLTAGNGFDTAELAKLSKHVYSFDIQPQAIQATKERIQDVTNVTLIQDSHANIKDYIHESLDFAIFNFGYLPKGDKTITTKTESSIQAVQACLDLLKEQGLLCLCFYIGHEEGKKEMTELLSLLKQQPLLLSSYQTHIENAPILYLVSKKGKKS